MARIRFLFVALGSAAIACSDRSSSSVSYGSREPYQVGIVTFDPDLPPEPRLPSEDEVCATLEASNNLVSRPDGALPPEADRARGTHLGFRAQHQTFGDLRSASPSRQCHHGSCDSERRSSIAR